MSIKRRVLAAAATMTMVGGVGAVGLLPADAATPSCGTSCVTFYGQEYGAPFVLDVLRQGEKVGQPIILFRTSNSDPAEDFTIADQGTVDDFYNGGVDPMVSEALEFNYAGEEAYEVEYSPYGVDSGLCVGVGSTAGNGTPVALEPCGASSKTVWVVDSNALLPTRGSTARTPTSPTRSSCTTRAPHTRRTCRVRSSTPTRCSRPALPKPCTTTRGGLASPCRKGFPARE
jgi:hypothetical protein